MYLVVLCKWNYEDDENGESKKSYNNILFLSRPKNNKMPVENKIKRSSEKQSSFVVEHFLFEDDFVEANVRCIPMIVRFKMDAAGIKLPLEVWCKFSVMERTRMAVAPCNTKEEVAAYHNELNELVMKYTGKVGKPLKVGAKPLWANLQQVPEALQKKAAEFDWFIKLNNWSKLTDLQRFALLKLFSPGHENKNFPKAMKEFGLDE